MKRKHQMDYNRYYEIAEELEAEGYSYEEAWEKAIKIVQDEG